MVVVGVAAECVFLCREREVRLEVVWDTALAGECHKPSSRPHKYHMLDQTRRNSQPFTRAHVK